MEILRFLRYISFLLGFSVFIFGKEYNSFSLQLAGAFIFWFVNIFYSFENIRKRIYFLMFNVTFFVFLMSRPVISVFIGKEWGSFDAQSVNFALNSIMISLVFMFLGHSFFDSYDKKFKNINTNKNKFWDFKDSRLMYNIRVISLILFTISMGFYFISETEKLIFMKSRNYTEYYTSFQTALPYFVGAIGSMHKYFLCIFLATLPSKGLALLPLGVYLISAVPSLLIGMRNPIVLNAIFIFLYYFTRDSIDIYKTKKERDFEKKKKWLGKLEWGIIIAALPVCLVFLGLYNYIRDGSEGVGQGVLWSIVDLIYKQGVSFDVLCIGYSTIPNIEYTGLKNYTFGGWIDYFTRNKLAQILFGTKSLGSGNNIDMALYSNNFSHRMSYASRGNEYLEGHGWGSSYILETYADFGYLGIIIFSFLLGMFFAYIFKFSKKSNLRFVITLVILTGIYFCPRDSALGWINFIFYTQFLFPLLVCYFCGKLLLKRYTRKRHILICDNL